MNTYEKPLIQTKIHYIVIKEDNEMKRNNDAVYKEKLTEHKEAYQREHRSQLCHKKYQTMTQ